MKNTGAANKKPLNTDAKNVKFKENVSEASLQPIQNEDATNKVTYVDKKTTIAAATTMFTNFETEIRLLLSKDRHISRKDTAEEFNTILKNLQKTLQLLSLAPVEDHEDLAYLVYNGSIYMSEASRLVQKTSFFYMTISSFISAISALESNVITLGYRYLEWRIQLYCELSKLYEENEGITAASKTIEEGYAKFLKVKELEYVDQPVPEYIENILTKMEKILKSVDFKYKLQLGSITFDAWKKLIEDVFKDKTDRIRACIETLVQRSKFGGNVFQTKQKLQWKSQILTYVYDLVKNDLILLTQQLEMQENFSSYKLEYSSIHGDENLKQAKWKKNLELNEKLMLRKDLIKLSNTLVLEHHTQLCKVAFELELWPLYEELSKLCNIRVRLRNYEFPYIEDVSFIKSLDPNPRIPNFYEKIEIDLNEGHMLMELKKYRKHNKKQRAQNESLEEEKGGKLKKNDPKINQQPVNNNIKMEPTQEELQAIKHEYVYMIIKRSREPRNVIYDIKVVVDFEKNQNGPAECSSEWDCKKIPVDQYQGVRETTKTVLWLCLKKIPGDYLDGEIEGSSFLIDMHGIIGRNPCVFPDIIWKKLNCDLRQTPPEFIKIPVNYYTYLCYRSDNYGPICKRELAIMDEMKNLILSLSQNKGAISPEEEIKRRLLILYSINNLNSLANTLKKMISQPIGLYFVEHSLDFLMSLEKNVYEKYVSEQIVQIDYVLKMLIKEEIPAEQQEEIFAIANEALDVFGSLYENFLKINQNCDEFWEIIKMIKLVLNLTRIYEKLGKYSKITQLLRIVIGISNSLRESLYLKGFNPKNDLFYPLSITCNGEKIDKFMNEMKEEYFKWKLKLERTIRNKKRDKEGKRRRTVEEDDEEEYEVLLFSNFFFSDNRKDSNLFDLVSKHEELEQLLSSYQLDLYVSLYRNELKKALQENQIGGETIKFNKSVFTKEQGISEKTASRKNYLKNPTVFAIKDNLNTLQTNLQDAKILPLPPPNVAKFEQLLLEEAGSNTVLKCVLYFLMAMIRADLSEQKTLLRLAFEQIKIAEKEEDNHLQIGLTKTPYLLESIFKNAGPNTRYPFDYLSNKEYFEEEIKPAAPILLTKGYTFIVIKLPYFEPKIPELLVREKPSRKIVSGMALFGKKSKNGVNVSLTCNALDNTGSRVQQGTIIHVPLLKPNHKYCFAAAAYDADDHVINGIGSTGEDIETFSPLPIPQALSYLGKITYQIGDDELALDILDQACSYYIRSRIIEHPKFGTQKLYNLNADYIKHSSINELYSASSSFLFHTRLLMKKINSSYSMSKGILQPHINNLIDTLRRLCVGLDIAIISRSFDIACKMVLDANNNLAIVFNTFHKPYYFFEIFVKIIVSASVIPSEWYDYRLRKAISCLLTQTVMMGFYLEEIISAKRSLLLGTKMPLRKWMWIPKTVMVPEEKIEDKKKIVQKQVPGAKKVKEEVVQAEEVKMIPKLQRQLIETPSLQKDMEEFVLSLSDNMAIFADYLNEQYQIEMENLRKYIGNDDVIDKYKNDMLDLLDFYSMFADTPSMNTKLNIKYKDNPNEYLIKFTLFINRLFVKETDTKIIQDYIGQFEVNIKSIESIFNQYLENLAKFYVNDDYLISTEPKILEINPNFTRHALKNELVSKLNQSINTFFNENMGLKENILMWFSEYFFIKLQILYKVYLKKYDATRLSSNPYKFYSIEILDYERTINYSSEVGLEATEDDPEQLAEISKLFNLISISILAACKANKLEHLNCLLSYMLNILTEECISPNYIIKSKSNVYLFQILDFTGMYFSSLSVNQELKNGCISNYLSIFSLFTQSALIEQKYNLILYCGNLAKNFLDKYIDNVWPFLMRCEDEKILLSNTKVAHKEKELREKEKEFENWKNKRKKSRQAMVSKEIPKEQIEFEAAIEALNKEFMNFTYENKYLQSLRQEFVSKLEEFKKNVNKGYDGLRNCRKSMIQYMGYIYQNQIINNIEKTDEVAYKNYVSAQRLFSVGILDNYKQVREFFEKRKENFMLLQTLHETGNLLFTLKKFDQAEDAWIDAFDTIFQKRHSLKNRRELLVKLEIKNFALNFGHMQTLIGVIILHKWSKYFLSNTIDMQRDAAVFAAELCFHILSSNHPHPRTYADYSNYVLEDFTIIINNNDSFSLNYSDLVESCAFHSRFLFEDGIGYLALPMICIMQYIANDILSNQKYVMEALLLKVLCSTNCGRIRDALQLLIKIGMEKGLASFFRLQSWYYKLEKGFLWKSDISDYYDDKSPYDEQNIEVISYLLKLELKKTLIPKISLYNYNLFYFTKAYLLYIIHSSESHEKVDVYETRFNKLKKAEPILRTIIKRLSFEDEFYTTMEYILMNEKDKNTQKVVENNAVLKHIIENEENIDSSEIEYLFLPYERSNFGESRRLRLHLLLSARHLLQKISSTLYYYSRAYAIERMCLESYMNHCQRLFEKRDKGKEEGIDPWDDESLNEKGGKNAAQKKQAAPIKDEKKESNKKEPLTKPNQKGVKKQEIKTGPTEEEILKAQIEKVKQALEEGDKSTTTRSFADPHWYIRIKYTLVSLLLKQKKIIEAKKLLEITLLDCKKVQDSFVAWQLKALDVKIDIMLGNTAEARSKISSLCNTEWLYEDKLVYCTFAGDFAETLVDTKEYEQSILIYKNIIECGKNELHRLSYVFLPENLNNKITFMILKELQENMQEIEQKLSNLKIERGKAGRDEKKDKKPSGKAGVNEVNIILAPIEPYLQRQLENFAKEINPNLNNLDYPADIDTKLKPTIYLPLLEIFIKSALSYSKLIIKYYTFEPTKLNYEIERRANMFIEKIFNENMASMNLIESIISTNCFLNPNYKTILYSNMASLYQLLGECCLFTEQMKLIKSEIRLFKKLTRKLKDKMPANDILPLKSLLIYPNFAKILNEKIIPNFETARRFYRRTLQYLKDESLLICGFSVESFFIDFAFNSCRLQHYKPRKHKYKFVSHKDISEYCISKGIHVKEDELIELFNKAEREYLAEQNAYEWEFYQYYKTYLDLKDAKKTLLEKPNSLTTSNIDINKLPIDIVTEIFESDYIYKKNYAKILFDEGKKKNVISSLDLLYYLSKLFNENKALTFTSPEIQRKINSVHRYLKLNLPQYSQKFIPIFMEPDPKEDAKIILQIPESTIIASINQITHQAKFRFTFFLAKNDCNKILNWNQVDEGVKKFWNERNENVFSVISMLSTEVNEFLETFLDLRCKMELSSTKYKTARDRDFKFYKNNLCYELELLAEKFVDNDKIVKFEFDEDKILVHMSKIHFIILDDFRELLDFFISVLSGRGSYSQNHVINAILKYFYSLRYY